MGNSLQTQSIPNESELIQKLYGSLTDKEGFHSFLQLLGGSINASACVLACLQRNPIAIRSVWHMGLPDGFVDAFQSGGMLERDIVFNLSVKNSLRNFSSASDALIEIKQGGNDAYWDSCYEGSLQMGYHQSMWMVLHASDDSVVVLSLLRYENMEQYSEEELEKLNKLVPHIRQAYQLYEQVNKAMVQASSLSMVLDALNKPVIVLSDLSNVIHANRVALEQLENIDEISISAGHIVFDSAYEQTEFSSSMVDVLRSSLGLCDYSSFTHYLKRKSGRDLIISVTPVENNESGHGGALVAFYDPDIRRLPTAEVIAKYFSLTKAEAQLCSDLVEGTSLKDIAQKRHKSEATLRSYLKNIYQKTGFNRQGQLVSGILSALMT